MQKDKLNLLILPALFPESDGDIKGIFILDYIKAVDVYCRVFVLVLQFTGKKKGLSIEEHKGYTLYRYVFSDKKRISKIRKYLYYLKWPTVGKHIVREYLRGIRLIHAHGGVLYGNLARLVSRSQSIPYVITEHTGPFSKISGKILSGMLCKYAMERAGAVLAVSNDLKEQILQASIKPPKLITTYNPVDTELFALKKVKGARRFLFVGRLEDYKGALKCVRAFNKIHMKYPLWTFVIIGEGPQKKKIETFLNENPPLAGKVKLAGKLSKAGISSHLQESDFFVYPSEHETFGLVIAEAMSCGLPVIVGNLTAPKEYVDEDSGLLIAPMDIDKISEAIEYMINNYSNYNSQLIRQKVVSRFGFDAFGERLMDIYRDLLSY